MGSAVVQDVVSTEGASVRTTMLGALATAGFASLGAGAIHAAAIGVHSEHRQAVLAFATLAAFQLGWAVIALTQTGRVFAAVGVIGNTAAVGGWVLAKTAGISFVEGLDEVEPIQLADGLAAGLGLFAALAAAAYLVPRGRTSLSAAGRAPAAVGFVMAAFALPGMVAVGSHAHAAADGHDEATADVHAATAVVPPKPYDPTKPIDLGGVEGVTPEQQARAENLIAITLLRLPKYNDAAVAEAAGFRSIGDGVTGYEHFVNYAYIGDDKVLDPDFPESLVYRVVAGQRALEAAMYMLPIGSTLDTVPDVGGRLMQWHIHENLCFTPDPAAPRVAGLTQPDGSCAAPLKPGLRVPMIHVWVVPHRCGPFAALEGLGAGSIKANETRLCDHAHGAAPTQSAVTQRSQP